MEKKSGGELVLESKHLAGLFLLLVVIFGVVFTLGYLMGRSQYDSKLRALAGNSAQASAAPPSKTKDAAGTAENLPPQKSSDWDFYHSGEPKKSEDHLQPAASPSLYAKSVATAKTAPAVETPAPGKPSAAAAGSAAKSAKQAKSPAPLNAPLIPKGAVILQVAAVLREGDALALAQALQQKKFPAFVLTPTSDKYYRVQVGPYGDVQTAANARQDLEANGFKSIVKR